MNNLTSSSVFNHTVLPPDPTQVSMTSVIVLYVTCIVLIFISGGLLFARCKCPKFLRYRCCFMCCKKVDESLLEEL